MIHRTPDYSGGSLLNLVAELEQRLTGSARAEPLHRELADRVPEAATYVLMLFDGLGDHQLDHPAAAALRSARAGAMDAMFPTTTSANLATIATGLAPSAHGLVAHQLYLPKVDQVVNTLKWTTPWGDAVPLDHQSVLPADNLWERLRRHDIEPITVQPGHFEASPLSQVLYRGCRYESIWTIEEIATATLQLAATPGRLIFTYFPNVDVAAHLGGQKSEEYEEALQISVRLWDHISARLPAGATLLGTADHGLRDYRTEDKVRIPHRPGPLFYGDPRALLVRDPDDELRRLAATLPGHVVDGRDLRAWWGPGPNHPDLAGRAPHLALLPEENKLLMSRFMDKRLIGYHGGLTPEELRIPLLVGTT